MFLPLIDTIDVSSKTITANTLLTQRSNVNKQDIQTDAKKEARFNFNVNVCFLLTPMFW